MKTLPERNVRLWQESQENVRVVSANYTLTAYDDHIVVDSTSGDVVLTLPDILNGKRYWIIHELGGNLLTIQPSAGNTIVLPYGTTISIFKGSSLVFKAVSKTQWGIE